MTEIIDIRNAIEPSILSLPGITGIDIGRNSPESIIVYTQSLCPKITCNIPDEIGGVPVNLFVTGKIEALVLDRLTKNRPYFAGMSAGHKDITAGTLGVKCYDSLTREPLLLSNNHVFANQSSIQTKRANIGDAILQPGVYDGGIYPADEIATLLRWIDIDETGDNEFDEAIARPTTPDDFGDVVLDIGKITEIGDAVIGDEVIKSGRTSGLTEGVVKSVNATLKIGFSTFEGLFKNQIVIAPAIASRGDSGSLLVRKGDMKAIGMVNAGSDTISVAQKMPRIAEQLGIDLGTPYSLSEPGGQGNFWGTVAALGLPLLIWKAKKGNKINKSKRRRY